MAITNSNINNISTYRSLFRNRRTVLECRERTTTIEERNEDVSLSEITSQIAQTLEGSKFYFPVPTFEYDNKTYMNYFRIDIVPKDMYLIRMMDDNSVRNVKSIRSHFFEETILPVLESSLFDIIRPALFVQDHGTSIAITVTFGKKCDRSISYPVLKTGALIMKILAHNLIRSINPKEWRLYTWPEFDLFGNLCSYKHPKIFRSLPDVSDIRCPLYTPVTLYGSIDALQERFQDFSKFAHYIRSIRKEYIRASAEISKQYRNAAEAIYLIDEIDDSDPEIPQLEVISEESAHSIINNLPLCMKSGYFMPSSMRITPSFANTIELSAIPIIIQDLVSFGLTLPQILYVFSTTKIIPRLIACIHSTIISKPSLARPVTCSRRRGLLMISTRPDNSICKTCCYGNVKTLEPIEERYSMIQDEISGRKIIESVNGWDGVNEFVHDLLDYSVGRPGGCGTYVYKSVRAGFTSNGLMSLKEQGLHSLVITHTTQIHNDTIIDVVKRLWDRDHPDNPFISLPFFDNTTMCPISHEGHVQGEDEILPITFRGNCKKCPMSENNCAFKYFMKHFKQADVVYITFKKLSALIVSESPVIRRFLNELFAHIKVIFVDECSHMLENMFVQEKFSECRGTDLNTRANPADMIANVINTIRGHSNSRDTMELVQYLERVKNAVSGINDQIVQRFSTQFRFTESFVNNARLQNVEELVRVTEKIRLRYRHDVRVNNGTIPNILFNAYKTAVKLIEVFGSNPLIYITRRVYQGRTIVEDMTGAALPKTILGELEQRIRENNIFMLMTDATEPFIPLNMIFENLDIEYQAIGDPLGTYKKQKVYVHSGFNLYSIQRNDETYDSLCDELVKYSGKKTFFVFASKRIYNFFVNGINESEKYFVVQKSDGIKIRIYYGTVDWYRGVHTVGVPSSCRTMVIIGSPDVPNGSNDSIAKWYIDNGYSSWPVEELGQAINAASASGAISQTSGRVRCPRAEVDSEVHIFGCSAARVESWFDNGAPGPAVYCQNSRRAWYNYSQRVNAKA